MKRLLPIRLSVAVAAAHLAAVCFAAPAAADETAATEKPVVTIRPRLDVLEENGSYPCTECHDGESQKANPVERELEDEHDDLAPRHGGDRFWCLSCHNKDARDSLIDLKGRKVSFDDSHKVCIQCHATRAQDFYRGGHGKRVANWQGDREISACVECHNPHSPAIKPRQPVALPKLRKGLPAPAKTAAGESPKPWEKIRVSREKKETK